MLAALSGAESGHRLLALAFRNVALPKLHRHEPPTAEGVSMQVFRIAPEFVPNMVENAGSIMAPQFTGLRFSSPSLQAWQNIGETLSSRQHKGLTNVQRMLR